MGRLAQFVVALGATALLLGASAPLARAQRNPTSSAVLALEQSHDPRARAHAAEVLGRSGDDAMAAHLVRALHGDRDAMVRAACASSLAHFGAPLVRAALERARSDRASIVRRAATNALAALPAPPVSRCVSIGIYLVDTHEHYYELCDDELVRRSRPWPDRD